MKVTILDLLPGEEEEIIVKCNQLSEDMMRLLARFKQGNDKLTVYQNGRSTGSNRGRSTILKVWIKRYLLIVKKKFTR